MKLFKRNIPNVREKILQHIEEASSYNNCLDPLLRIHC